VRKRLALAAAGVVALYIFGLGATNFLSAQASAAAPRDDETGVMTGAEPYTLGPEDAAVAVLFIHGFVGAGDNFADLPQRVADTGARVHVMRLPGHGTRSRELREITPDELREAVLEEVRALKEAHDKVVLVGHSMGGTLSALINVEEPVDGIVFGAAYFGVTHKWYYGLRPETWSKLTAPIVPWIYKGKVFMQVNDDSVKDEITSYTWIPSKASVALGQLGKAVNEPAVLEAVTGPVLMFHSKGDVAASPDAAERAFEGFPSEDKTFVWINDSNHHIFWDYDREKVAEETLAFIERVRGIS
jgi:carboxylesterase